MTLETIMLRLTKSPQTRISNRLAGFAALLLLVTSISGIGNSIMSFNQGDSQFAAAVNAGNTQILAQSTGSSKAKTDRRFKASLFLFRN